MKSNFSISKRFFKKVAILTLLIGSTVGTFAMLGTPGRGKKTGTTKSLLSIRTNNYSGITLNSGYQFRGSQVINANQDSKFIQVNTMVSYQRGHTTYTMPLKKKVVLNGKLTFNPNSATR